MSLMEAMVALVIFTVGILGMTTLQLHASRGLETAGAITMAANLGTNVLDELRVSDFATLANGTRYYDRFGAERVSPDYYTVSTTITGGDLKTVTVTAAWTEGTFDRDVQFQTRIAR
jgi:type IV pilus modification protein PilV